MSYLHMSSLTHIIPCSASDSCDTTVSVFLLRRSVPDISRFCPVVGWRTGQNHTTSPSPPSSVTHVHRWIGSHNPTWQTLTNSTRLTYISVYDRRDGASAISKRPPPFPHTPSKNLGRHRHTHRHTHTNTQWKICIYLPLFVRQVTVVRTTSDTFSFFPKLPHPIVVILEKKEKDEKTKKQTVTQTWRWRSQVWGFSYIYECLLLNW